MSSEKRNPLPEERNRITRASAEQFAREAYRYKPQLLRLAGWLLHDDDAAEDAVEEAILHGAAKQEQLADRSRLAGWLARIVYNRCLALKRRSRTHTPLADVAPFLPDERSGGNPAEKAQLIEQIEKVLDTMLFLEPPAQLKHSIWPGHWKRPHSHLPRWLTGSRFNQLFQGRENNCR